jgi:Protein of unknown function (DUF1688)
VRLRGGQARVPQRRSAANGPGHAVRKLHRAAAVRERCRMVCEWVENGRSQQFTLDRSRLGAVADYVADVTREAYPDLAIPYHSRWRHFSAGGLDRWSDLAKLIVGGPVERARSAVDLAVVSVLLDAGAGDAWRYRENRSGRALVRSEGLAVASLDMFRAGAFSCDPAYPHRVDAAALAAIDAEVLARHFQSDAGNPLVGIVGRSALLRRLAAALAERPDVFGPMPARPGGLVDHFMAVAEGGRIAASQVLAALLELLSSIWPSGLVLNGLPVGDAGRHPAARSDDETSSVVPFHKLTQWLTYSLTEPLETAGLAVERLDELTALAEYRNGGLLVDLGVIRPHTPLDPGIRHDVGSEFVVEWRALTVALMDPLVGLVRARLGLGAEFTMPHLLQGGTWSAGRKIATRLRPPYGPSPITVAADGTVF